MKKICILLLSAELFFGASLFAADSEIRLSGRKDRVLSSKVRQLVLDVAEECLNHEDEDYIASIEEIKSPFAFKEVEEAPAVATVAETTDNTPEAVEVVAPVVYDDASILRVVGDSFSKQVRGTLARGSVHYLQLQGGGMLKSGTSFPAKIPELEGQSFTVTVTDISSRDYTLKLKDATLTIPIGSSSSGATRDSAR